jgi:HAD superfamily hydrolase (TIGR01509 family)
MSSFPLKFKAVLFDFDGVLVDTEWAIYEAWLETFRAESQDLPLELYTRCIGSDFATWSPKTYLEELTGATYDWVAKDEARQVVIRRDLEQAGPMPGVVDLLRKLKVLKVPCAVVSSSSHDWVDGWLAKLELADFFQTTVCRGDVPRIKPAPDLWLEALRRLDVSGSETLAIEDSLNGVKSAKAAGLNVWAIPNRCTAELDFSQADQRLGSMTDAAERLLEVVR